MSNPIDKAALARRFLALGAAEQKRFLELLQAKGIRFELLPLVPAPRGERLPASHAQRRLWLAGQLEPESSAYHMVGAFALDGTLDRPALLGALALIVERHEALRTRFVEADGEPWQVIDPPGPPALEEHDLRGAPQRLEELANAHAARPFDLAGDPPLRVQLLRLDAARWRLQIVTHHIVSDGWSIGVFAAELAGAYAALQQGRAPALAPLPIQYADFALWQRAWLEAGEGERQLAYWRERLGGEQPPLALPYRQDGGAGRSAARLVREIPAALAARLGELARGEGATLFQLLLAAFQLLLARYSGQRDIRVGVPVANRQRAEIAPLIGFFVNTQVLRAELRPRESFRDLLGQVRQRALEAQEHQDLPFDRLVEALAPARSPGQTPLFQVLFNHQRRDLGALHELPGLRLTPLEQPVPHAIFDLALDSEEGADGALCLVFTHARERLDGTLVVRMAGHFAGLLERLGESLDRPLAQLELLDAQDRAQLEAWNACRQSHDPSHLLPELIAEQARLRPEAVALVHGATRVTYAELEARANRLARHLIACGVGPEARVGLCLERGTAMIEGLLAILKAGGAFVPLDPDYPRERLAYMAEDSGLKWLLTTGGLRGRVPLNAEVETLCLDTLDLGAHAATPPAVAIHPLNLAYLIYTSGSTGRPKGVAVNHAGLSMHVQTIGQRYGMTAEDVELHFASISFDGAVERWAVPLAFGSRLVIRDQQLWSAEQTCEVLQREGVTIACFPPSYVGQLLDWIEAQHLKLPVRSWTLGGEAFTRETYERLQRVLQPKRIVNGYGPTETVVTPLIWEAFPGTALEAAYAPIGTPVGPRRLYVLDGELNPLPLGVAGELYIGGEIGLARGYHQRPELTAERFLPDPFGAPGERMYRTGDLVRWRADGALDYLGRLDQQVKIRGFRIELGEIESRLLADESVAEAAVIARETPSGKQLVGYLVPRGPLDPPQVRRQLAEALPDYLVPAQLVVLERLPLTPAGKLDRAALPEPQWQARDDYEAPQGDSERTLAEIWAQLLGLPRVGRQDRFFELGGDSIVALQVVGRARQQGLALSPRDLFQHQRLADLALAARPLAAPAVDTGPAEGVVPLTPIQAHFFALCQAVPAHWNQSLWLELQRPLDPVLLEQALQALVAHHDALRLRFAAENGVWRQWYGNVDERHALLWRREASDDGEAEVFCAAAQRSLDLQEGPLLRALYLRQHGQPDRLLLAIHHLAVDGVSWRILLEDLLAAYRQLAAGQGAALPARTCSFKAWAEHLQRWASGEEARRELDLWCSRLAGPVPARPAARASFAERRSLRLAFDRATTQRLLGGAAGGRADALLLAALTRAYCAWSGAPTLRVDLEGHGREALAEGLDPSRTVGWFTSLYPLRLPAAGDPLEQLERVLAGLRQVPHGGVGYGALRWLGPPEARAALAALPPAQLTFNYLGQYAGEADGWFRLLEGGGAQQAPDNPLGSLLAVNGQVFDGELALAWEYAAGHYAEAAIRTLAEAFRGELLALLDALAGASAAGPSPLVRLSRRTAPGTPLFCLHPVTGRVTGYQPLAGLLEGRYGLLGLQCRSFLDPQWRDASLAAMADAYLEALLTEQPRGPYRLLGWSLGGSLALELAARLEARGETVAFLGLLDCYVPGTEIPADDARHPEARVRFAGHLRLLLPELAAPDQLLERLAPLAPLDWPAAGRAWLAAQPLDALARQSLEELLFAWAVEQHLRRLCAGYRLPEVAVRPHCWWAAQPPGRTDLLRAGLRRVLGEPAGERLVDTDHLGIVRAAEVLAGLAQVLDSLQE
ncbi:non-ribosomal peptide synthase domain TIGR01720/amino acid adenylation domain-containing protein [Azotobacter beijerinckii]|uniref:Non-ribosomal peptide synthase domain TIGR01720/amino acid adenylation domain-containing protein n=1 Tax=Azotobacter beijerinckii TaxID=170623 RepID=A0A1H6Q9W3_9GAMM|nr:non-ribosomal peptide synthetase [Azotobacter beijerinckii]SEI40591.1 non-ribosomal peptide synthase domain TIGR01720/amino acid adenylation domain-containing protein [Azotobacter beijerinckii]